MVLKSFNTHFNQDVKQEAAPPAQSVDRIKSEMQWISFQIEKKWEFRS